MKVSPEAMHEPSPGPLERAGGGGGQCFDEDLKAVYLRHGHGGLLSSHACPKLVSQ